MVVDQTAFLQAIHEEISDVPLSIYRPFGWPRVYLQEIANAMYHRDVKVEIILSNPGSLAGRQGEVMKTTNGDRKGQNYETAGLQSTL